MQNNNQKKLLDTIYNVFGHDDGLKYLSKSPQQVSFIFCFNFTYKSIDKKSHSILKENIHYYAPAPTHCNFSFSFLRFQQIQSMQLTQLKFKAILYPLGE